MIKLNEAGMKDRIIFFVFGALLATISYVAGDMSNFSSADDGDFIKVFKNVHIEQGLSVGDYITIGGKSPDSVQETSDWMEESAEKVISGEISLDEYVEEISKKVEKRAQDLEEEIGDILSGKAYSDKAVEPSIHLSAGGVGSYIRLGSGGISAEKEKSISITTSQRESDEFQYPYIKMSNPPFTKTINVR